MSGPRTTCSSAPDHAPAELAQRNAANLAITIQELDAARPTSSAESRPRQRSGWIDQARSLQAVVEHKTAKGGQAPSARG